MAGEKRHKAEVERVPRTADLTRAERWLVVALAGIPLLLIAMKLLPIPGSEAVANVVSLDHVPHSVDHRVRYLLFFPLGAMMVVFVRITLGIRVLGPFRSILLAVAFQITGITLGLIFLLLVIGVIVAVRPVLRGLRIAYFGRVSVTLSMVAALMLAAIWVSQWIETGGLLRVAYFPVVVLTLTGDGFARTLKREGVRSAAWRGAVTALVAVLITLLSRIPGFEAVLIRFPELLVLEIAMIIVITRLLGFRLLESLNPAPARKKRGKRTRARRSPQDRRMELTPTVEER